MLYCSVLQAHWSSDCSRCVGESCCTDVLWECTHVTMAANALDNFLGHASETNVMDAFVAMIKCLTKIHIPILMAKTT